MRSPCMYIRAAAFLAGLTAGAGLAQLNPPSPTFTADSILNAASGLPDSYSPYSLLTIHGANLALNTTSLNFDGLREVPVALTQGGTRVLIRSRTAGMLYAAPDQIVALVPPDLPLGPAQIVVMVAAMASRPVTITVRKSSPALFLQADNVAAVTRQDDGTNFTSDSPAVPGDAITLFATGLGVTKPAPSDWVILQRLAPVTLPLQVLLDGVPVSASLIDYAGIQPGLAGTYQIRMRLPPETGPDPEIRVDVDGVVSPEGIRIPVRIPEVVQAAASRKLSRSAAVTRGSPSATWSRRPFRIQLSSSLTSE